MTMNRQIPSIALLVMGSFAVAAGCSDDDEDNGYEGEGGYAGHTMSVGGMRTTVGGASTTGGTHPTTTSGGTYTSSTSVSVGGTTWIVGGATSTTSTNTDWGLGGNGSNVGGATGAGGSTSLGGGASTTTGGIPTSGVAGSRTTGVAGNSALAGAGGAVGQGGAGASAGGSNIAGNAGMAGAPSARMSFFVTSDTNTNGDLGGLTGADARCQALANAVGHGSGVWHAYLSADARPSNGNVAVNARDRIGTGPWYNANGRLLANNLTELHSMVGNVDLFVDEHGMRINGQWQGSPTPIEHDILTGSTPSGTVMTGYNCEGWTSNSAGIQAQVGHSDGLGPAMSSDPPYDSWNSSHANESCANTAPRGGAGRLYCFRVD